MSCVPTTPRQYLSFYPAAQRRIHHLALLPISSLLQTSLPLRPLRYIPPKLILPAHGGVPRPRTPRRRGVAYADPQCASLPTRRRRQLRAEAHDSGPTQPADDDRRSLSCNACDPITATPGPATYPLALRTGPPGRRRSVSPSGPDPIGFTLQRWHRRTRPTRTHRLHFANYAEAIVLALCFGVKCPHSASAMNVLRL